jgi:hypothetical protein
MNRLTTFGVYVTVMGLAGWWLWLGGQRARRVYRRWRYYNSIAVYRERERGRPRQVDVVRAALLALGGPLIDRGAFKRLRRWVDGGS